MYDPNPNSRGLQDGVSAAACLYEFAIDTYAAGGTLQQRLTDLYERYGYFVTNNSYVRCECLRWGPCGRALTAHGSRVAVTRESRVEDLFDEIRNDGRYFLCLNSEFVLSTVRDLTGEYLALPPKRC